jgi:dTDP-4-dehydrorhamnose reductase
MAWAGPILVTGASGQIGGAVARLAKEQGIEVEAPGRDGLDLAQPLQLALQLAEMVKARPWSAIINCAAYTAVDKAEEETELAFTVNAKAPAVLAEAAAKRGIAMLHVSTDYIFDGTKTTPYVEEDAINPLGIYGHSKADGEAAVIAANGPYAIVRTAWVLSAGPRNFLDTMLRLGKERDALSIVADQKGSPTNASDVAASLLRMAADMKDRQGIWHCVNAGKASWYDLAAHIFAFAEKYGQKAPKLSAITTADYPTPAKRPANSRLSVDKLQQDFAIEMRPWQDAVDAILTERFGKEAQ